MHDANARIHGSIGDARDRVRQLTGRPAPQPGTTPDPAPTASQLAEQVRAEPERGTAPEAQLEVAGVAMSEAPRAVGERVR
jgi:hypothetical protein